MPNTSPYPFVVAWGKYMGSNHSYIRDQVARAQATDAPYNAINEKYAKDGSGRTGEWRTVDDIADPYLREQISAAARTV